MPLPSTYSRNHSRSHLSPHTKTFPSRQASPPRAIPELPLVMKTSPFRAAYSPRSWLHPRVLSSNHWDICLLMPLLLSTLKTCNAPTFKAGSYGSEEISCMQSQESSTHNLGHYNKFAHEGRAVTGTSSTLIHHQQLSRNGLLSPMRRGQNSLWT